MDFSQVKAITIPAGSVKSITDSQGRVLWKTYEFTASGGSSASNYKLAKNTAASTSNTTHTILTNIPSGVTSIRITATGTFVSSGAGADQTSYYVKKGTTKTSVTVSSSSNTTRSATNVEVTDFTSTNTSLFVIGYDFSGTLNKASIGVYYNQSNNQLRIVKSVMGDDCYRDMYLSNITVDFYY